MSPTRTSRRATARIALGLAGLALSLVLLAPASPARADYPASLPDFAAAPAGSGSDFNATNGNLDRPMLVIYEHFTDVAEPAGHDAAWLARRVFGAFPSVADYFRAGSFGRFLLTPAYETSGGYDGVVEVTTGTAAQHDARTEEQRNRLALTLAEEHVDYAGFDTDGNGVVTTRELRVLRVHAPRGTGDFCGNNRGPGSGPLLDGVAVSPIVAVVGGNANLITTIHETGHALVPRDFYGFGVGRLDLYGPTCSPTSTPLFGVGAYLKVHLGWVEPTVVTRDGYYTVPRADATPRAFLLYDHAHGPADYFLVENRRIEAGSYDQSATDSGLVVWRVDEAQFASGSESVRPLEIIRPDGRTNPGCGPGGCYSGSNGDAWDPSDPATPQRTMSSPWRDGTAARVAVRAIGPAGPSIRAYFDVRGPGVLVQAPGEASATVGRTGTISVPVRNTGESAAAVAVTLVDLPSSWRAATASVTLGPQAETTVPVAVTVPAGWPLGPTPVAVEGRNLDDPSASSRLPVDVTVVAAGSTAPPPPYVPPMPTLSAFSISPRAFAVITPGRRARRGRPRGTSLRFTLSGQADVTITLDRLLAGRRRNGRCATPGRRPRGARCTLVRRAGELTRSYRPAGTNRVAFSGRPTGRALSPGRYRATIRATNAGGTSRAAVATFTVLAG